MTHLKPGDLAPSFIAINQDGQTISLSDYIDKKLILYFYPKDNTPGCTAESCSLNHYSHKFTDLGFNILGVSPDSEKTHIKFITKYNLSFDLIADVDKKVCSLYGVWGEKKFMGREYMGVHRTTFVLNHSLLIERVFTRVNTKEHSQQILESYK